MEQPYQSVVWSCLVNCLADMFAVIVQSVLTGISHMMVMLLSLLCITVSWLMLVPFGCNLYIMIFTDAPIEISCSIVVPGDVLCFN